MKIHLGKDSPLGPLYLPTYIQYIRAWRLVRSSACPPPLLLSPIISLFSFLSSSFGCLPIDGDCGYVFCCCRRSSASVVQWGGSELRGCCLKPNCPQLLNHLKRYMQEAVTLRHPLLRTTSTTGTSLELFAPGPRFFSPQHVETFGFFVAGFFLLSCFYYCYSSSFLDFPLAGLFYS